MLCAAKEVRVSLAARRFQETRTVEVQPDRAPVARLEFIFDL